ncbi:ATP-binding protein [Candidatus Parcubacteria bacterium]|nr:MAG: ATP-binding protein [Candidatus Parcubacteria bacterium]
MQKKFAKVYAAELEGVDAALVEVEVDLNVGLHAFNIVGLADKAVNEARERVSSALKHAGAKPPNRDNRKITVNLAPASVKKAGSHYDLAIAVGYLLASGQLQPAREERILFLGELGLDGSIRPVRGALSIAELAATLQFDKLILPQENAGEAVLVQGITIIPAASLRELIDVLEGRSAPSKVQSCTTDNSSPKDNIPDLAEIKGQESAKRALLIAAAGNHNLLMAGPPGMGKSMLARALVGILPPLTPQESIEVTKVYSAAGLAGGTVLRTRPFRAPHYTASPAAMIGGGTNPRPGEISLAHRGVLFLDELPEFPRNVLEALRQPLEEGSVVVSRAASTVRFPARFSLLAAMNPCPCGFYGDTQKECTCSAHEVARYQKKVSGPLLDRIDLQIFVARVPLATLRNPRGEAMTSAAARAQVQQARALQRARFASLPIHTNAEMTSKETTQFVALTKEAGRFLEQAARANLSPRSYYRILKVARTIADLEASPCVTEAHLAEAFSYRLRAGEPAAF